MSSENKTYKIAVLPGDGIGPEVMREALRVLDAVAAKFGRNFKYTEAAIGGAGYDAHGAHFPDETRKVCEASDAILFGSVGGPIKDAHMEKWKGCEANSILALRKTFKFNANFRPARVYPQLVDICPLKKELISSGVDLLVVRELLGDIYFGAHETTIADGRRAARDVAEYTEEQIADIARIGFSAAQKRRKKLTSVDKANVLDTSKLWRTVVHEVHAEYKDVQLEDMLVDNCAMQLVMNPSQFDVILAPNLFGDILSDAAAVLPGSLGLTPSASLNSRGMGLYEPSGGSAPDIAGKGVANPAAQILSAALMLKYSFNLQAEAQAIESALDAALDSGFRTGDIMPPPGPQSGNAKLVGTKEFTDAILSNLS